MNNWLSRTEGLIGKKAVDKLKNSHVTVCGCGGVGSYVIEGLVRAGIGNITIIDNDVIDISRMFLSDYFKGINSFDYLEEINTINVEYLNQVLKDVFNEKNMILSVVKS